MWGFVLKIALFWLYSSSLHRALKSTGEPGCVAVIIALASYIVSLRLGHGHEHSCGLSFNPSYSWLWGFFSGYTVFPPSSKSTLSQLDFRSIQLQSRILGCLLLFWFTIVGILLGNFFLCFLPEAIVFKSVSREYFQIRQYWILKVLYISENLNLTYRIISEQWCFENSKFYKKI